MIIAELFIKAYMYMLLPVIGIVVVDTVLGGLLNFKFCSFDFKITIFRILNIIVLNSFNKVNRRMLFWTSLNLWMEITIFGLLIDNYRMHSTKPFVVTVTIILEATLTYYLVGLEITIFRLTINRPICSGPWKGL